MRSMRCSTGLLLSCMRQGHAGNASWMSAMEAALESPSDLTYGDAFLANSRLFLLA